MRTSRLESHAALRQLSVLLIACVTLASFAIAWMNRPAGADELRIPIEELQSQAAELATLESERRSGHLPQRSARAHLRQLARLQHGTFQELAQLRVRPELSQLKAAALGDGLALVRHMTLLRGGAAVSADEPAHVRDRLGILVRRLRH